MIKSQGGSVFGMRVKLDALLTMLTCPFFNSLPCCSLEWWLGKCKGPICTFCSSLLWPHFFWSGCLVLILVRGFDCETYKTECWFPSQAHLLSMNREGKSNKGHTFINIKKIRRGASSTFQRHKSTWRQSSWNVQPCPECFQHWNTENTRIKSLFTLYSVLIVICSG